MRSQVFEKADVMRWMRQYGVLVAACSVLAFSSIVSGDQADKTFIAGVLANFPPQYTLDADTGEPRGFAIDTMEAIAEQAGIAVEYAVFDTWEDVQQALCDRRIDIIPNMGITEDRKAWMLFTQPLEVFDVAIFVRASTRDIRSVDDLRGRYVAVVTTNVGATLVQGYADVKPVFSHSASDALLSLLSGQCDALIYPAPVIRQIARNARLEKHIKIVGESLLEIKRAVAVRLDRLDLLVQLDEAVQALLETSAYQNIYARWYGEPRPFWNAANVAMLMGSLLVIVVIGTFLWRHYSLIRLNTLLRRTIAERKQAEHALRHSEEQYRLLFETMAQGVVYQNAEGQITAANQAAERILGLTLDQMQGRTSFDPRWKAIHEDGSDFPGDTHPAIMALRTGQEVHNVVMGVFHPQEEQYHWIDINAVPQFKLGETTPYQVYTTFSDITERKYAEEKLAERTEILERIFDKVPAMICFIDKDGRIKLVNSEFERVFGWRLNEIREHPDIFTEIYPDLDYRSRVMDFIREGSGAFAEFQSHARGGRILTTSFANIILSDGTSIGVGLDITEHKQAEDAVRESEQKWRSLTEYSPDHIMLLDRDANILFINRTIPGLIREEVIGISFYVYALEKYKPVARDCFEGVLNTGERGIFESIYRYPDGTLQYFESHVGPVKRGDSIVGLTVSSRDITDRKQAEEELRKYHEHLEDLVKDRTAELRVVQEELVRKEKLATLGQLSGGVAHELRNPLGAISNTLYLLNMLLEDPEPEVRDALAIVKKEVDTSEGIINSLLNLANPGSPIQRKVNLNDVVQQALSDFTVPGNIEIICQLDNALPEVLADPDQLKQIFGNIARNAMQAMPDGGQLAVKTSKVSGKSPTPDTVTVSFADTGVGIAQEDVGKIFEPLFTTKAKGIGLGLALSKMLIEAHGGMIEVKSRVGQGSTFTVRLPIEGANHA